MRWLKFKFKIIGDSSCIILLTILEKIFKIFIDL
jgi:hypothetical protein